jgi:LPXTG-site transpeptidase (sortase) family protein
VRSERELLDIVYRRAAALKRMRRLRSVAVLCTLAAVVVAAGMLAARDADRVLVSGSGARNGTTSSDPTVQAPESVGRLEISAIGVNVGVGEGVTAEDLERGPGHYPETPLPGHVGNCAIAGHRTTHGAPFLRLDELKPGDEIVVTTDEGVFTYKVRETLIEQRTAVEVLGPTFWSDRWAQGSMNTLTLTTPHPKYSSAERMVVGAEMIGEALSEAPPST